MFYHSSYMLYLLSIDTYVLISWILHTYLLQVPLPYPGMYLIITTFSSYGWDIATSSTLVSKGVPMRAYCILLPNGSPGHGASGDQSDWVQHGVHWQVLRIFSITILPNRWPRYHSLVYAWVYEDFPILVQSLVFTRLYLFSCAGIRHSHA